MDIFVVPLPIVVSDKFLLAEGAGQVFGLPVFNLDVSLGNGVVLSLVVADAADVADPRNGLKVVCKICKAKGRKKRKSLRRKKNYSASLLCNCY